MISRLTFALLLCVNTAAAFGTDAALTAIAGQLVRRNWESVTLDEVVKAPPNDNIATEIFAPLSYRYECPDLRAISYIETINAGRCLSCLHLEFRRRQTAAPESAYVLTALRLTATFGARSAARKAIRELLHPLSIPPSVVEIPQHSGASVWQRSWSVPNEVRSLKLTVTRTPAGWQVEVDHRREQAPGVPAAPP